MFESLPIIKFLCLEKRLALFKAFVESQFRYCLLVRMFHGRKERSLRMVYDDCTSSPDALLTRDKL